MPSLEIACFSSTSALVASSHGATRIELCTNPSVGGTTPSLSSFTTLKNSNPTIKIPIYIMIRPHGNSFTYTPAEISEMKVSIETFKDAGADGFVFGMLTVEGRVDVRSCRELLSAAAGKKCTFHRAFDEILEERMGEELEGLVGLGFESVLTSGGKRSAVEGGDVLKGLVERTRGRIEVIVGGGVRSGNLEGLRRLTGARWFHSSAITEGGGEASEDEVRKLSELLR